MNIDWVLKVNRLYIIPTIAIDHQNFFAFHFGLNIFTIFCWGLNSIQPNPLNPYCLISLHIQYPFYVYCCFDGIKTTEMWTIRLYRSDLPAEGLACLCCRNRNIWFSVGAFFITSKREWHGNLSISIPFCKTKKKRCGVSHGTRHSYIFLFELSKLWRQMIFHFFGN